MIEEIVQTWVDGLLAEHGASALDELPASVIVGEIEESKANIKNCTLWGDRLGVACGEYYIELLTEHCYSRYPQSDLYTND